MSAAPLACVPGAIPAVERVAHFELLRRLFGAEARDKQEFENGYAFRFDATAFDDVARFVANERICCPFLDFRLEVKPAGGPIWLMLTGPDGTRSFLDAELGPQPEGA